MRNTLKSIFLAALLAQASTAIAQETQAEGDDQTDTTEQAGEDATPSDLSLGEPAPPRVGEPYVLQEFGDWEMRCVKAPEGQKDPCNLYQLLLDSEGNQIVVPLETLLTQQLTLAVDGGQPRRYPFTFCNAAGCVARVGFTQPEVDQFKRGNNATLRLVPAAAPTEEVLLTMSLTGFTAGFDGVVSIE